MGRAKAVTLKRMRRVFLAGDIGVPALEVKSRGSFGGFGGPPIQSLEIQFLSELSGELEKVQKRSWLSNSFRQKSFTDHHE